MKENLIKGTISAAVAGLTAYFRELVIPIVVLVCVLVIDYATGMIKAWMKSDLSSKKGIEGIVKKLSYMFLVCVGMIVDWLLKSGLQQAGIDYQVNGIVAVIIAVWLIINELISILENLKEIGVPTIPFLDKLLSKLRVASDKENNNEI